jgi:hypothetical protein
MEFVQAGLNVLIAAVLVAFTALVASKIAAGLWVVVTFVGRGVYWATIGWWVSRVKAALMGYWPVPAADRRAASDDSPPLAPFLITVGHAKAPPR